MKRNFASSTRGISKAPTGITGLDEIPVAVCPLGDRHSSAEAHGVAHSNQVREFVLSDAGIDLVDVSTTAFANPKRICESDLDQKLLLPLRRFSGDMSQTERILLGLDLRDAKS